MKKYKLKKSRQIQWYMGLACTWRPSNLVIANANCEVVCAHVGCIENMNSGNSTCDCQLHSSCNADVVVV